jgi:hypothetical protein
MADEPNIDHIYIGRVCVQATPMSRADYNTLRGWELPADECGEDDGFLLEPVAGFGHITWVPKDSFEANYRPATREELKGGA